MVNILIACTGSVASIKLPVLLSELTRQHNSSASPLSIRLITTSAALHFIPPSALSAPLEHFQDADEYTTWSQMGDPVLHIDLRNWADVLVVAPMSANTLAKAAAGMCDNLVTCHPATGEHLDKVKQWGYRVIEPVSKVLACGDIGNGAMAEPHTIARLVLQSVNALAAEDAS
ncbi:flavo protein [Catenaria anguillulae PL171]|uniref:Flavo protein n=1 Tax=Catenaria anguillulae PL171 TaxID=765915 RepID=A0A1Y2HR91_9FUNG|nr:flavo protein [Catenaria anguillulae PL171]